MTLCRLTVLTSVIINTIKLITKRCDNRNNNIPVGTEPQHTSSVVVLARTNCTLVGAGGFSKEKRKSLQTYLRVMEIHFKDKELLK